MKPSLKRMIADIEAEVEYTRSLIGRKALDPRVMAVMGQVPREKFVPHEMHAAAYDNGPLPIGHGQTISQPYIVALMTDLLKLGPEDRVLEIGTGSGYQTAILSCLAKAVYTVELIPELGDAAAGILAGLDYTNIHYRIGNGYAGWPEHAPYDAIIVTAAAPEVPPALIDQLKSGGRLVIPVGWQYMPQELMLIEKDAHNVVHSRDILGVAFVPLQDTEPAGRDDGTLH
jgi:protein-L-isoaspartate(D-aspartate) O-methyltransferase